MPHIHTGPGEHDHTASAVIIRNESDGPKVLLHLHKKLNRLLQPGGHVELHETPWQAYFTR
jgi:8-oxo-dGTP pyrophosphatase MutT (NUDIX family)